jgi:DNA replication protein DnaC
VVQPLQTADHRHQLQHQLQTSLQPAVLVSDAGDDLPRDRVEANDLCPWLGRRSKRGRAIVTRQTALAEWAAWWGDAVLAAALLARLRQHAEVLPLTGPSDRLQDRLPLGRAGSRARTS